MGKDLTVLGTTQTQGEKLLCAPKHFQYETQEMRVETLHSRTARQRESGCLAVVSAHPQPTCCHILYQDHSKLKDLIQRKTGPAPKKATNSSQSPQATQLCLNSSLLCKTTGPISLHSPMFDATTLFPKATLCCHDAVCSSLVHAFGAGSLIGGKTTELWLPTADYS